MAQRSKHRGAVGRIRRVWREPDPDTVPPDARFGPGWSTPQRLRIVVILLAGLVLADWTTRAQPWSLGNVLSAAIALWFTGMALIWEPPRRRLPRSD